MPDEKFLTADDIADRLRTSRRTLDRWIEQGRFPRGRRVGSRSMWTESDWAAYLLLHERWYPAGIDLDDDDDFDQSPKNPKKSG